MNRNFGNRQNPFKNGPPFQQNQQQNAQNRSPNPPSNPITVVSPPPKSRSGPCVACKAVTVLICSRCGDFYCSPLCQKNDWQKHRFICFAMPPLVNSSTDIHQNLPALNGYQNRELPAAYASTSGIQSQNKKWVNNSLTASPPPMQQLQRENPNSQQQNHHRQLPHQSQNQEQTKPNQNGQQQNHQNNRQLPPHSQNQNGQQQNHQNNRQPPQQSQNSRQRSPPKQNAQSTQSPTTSNSIGSSGRPVAQNELERAVNIGRVDRAPFPKNKSSVLVTAIRSSNRIFIRSIEKEENDGYVAAIKSINDYGRNASPLNIIPQKNSFAITNFNDDGLYYRVQIVSVIDENHIQVIYYDFGNEATKKLSELKDISMECAALKQYVNMAVLKNVPHIKDCPELIEYLRSFEDSDAKVLYMEKEKPKCEILMDGDDDSLNAKINLFIQKMKNQSEQPSTSTSTNERAVIPPVQQTQSSQQMPVAPVTAKKDPRRMPSQLAKPVMNPPFERKTLPVQAKNINVMVVDNSLMFYGCFACVRVEDKANLQEIQVKLKDYEDTGRPYKPKLEEYVLAKYQSDWYRAKVLSHLGDNLEMIVFIDFLNEAEVFVKDIRRYPMDLDLPCTTSLCMIYGLDPELDEDLTEYLKSKLEPGSEHKINEVTEMHDDGDDIVICQMNQVSQWIKEHKP